MMAIYPPYRSHSSTTPRGSAVEVNWQDEDREIVKEYARTHEERQPNYQFAALLGAMFPGLRVPTLRGRRVHALDLHPNAGGKLKDESPAADLKRKRWREWNARRKLKQAST